MAVINHDFAPLRTDTCSRADRNQTPTKRLWWIVMSLVVIMGLATALNRYKARERDRAESLADSLLTAPAAAVPYLLEHLRTHQHLVRSRLQLRLSTASLSPVERLHALFGLIESDHSLESVLLEHVATAPESECRNVIQALSHVKSSALPAIALRTRESAVPSLRARYAIVALHLGDPAPARAMLAVQSVSDNRTAFIHTYATWHGNPDDIADLLITQTGSDFRSGLCLALGTMEPAEQGHLPDALCRLYNEASDGATHSAAGWALRKWNHPLPVIKPLASIRGWFQNGQGLTMVEIPAGQFPMGTGEPAPFDDESPVHNVQITRSFFLADREITVDQFLQFVADAERPLLEKPREWHGYASAVSPTGDCPVQMVSWYDAVSYCNWLSGREGRQLCYQKIGSHFIKDYAGHEIEHDLWSCDFAANGYRLPTEAEWEYAARAHSSTSYCFGEGTMPLSHYAWFRNNSGGRTWPGGLKLPNTWGLFDMHGNVAEWCWDFESAYTIDPGLDPTGPSSGTTRVQRGGAAGSGDLGCRSAHRTGHYPAYRTAWSGFRVCCCRPDHH